MEAYAWYGYVSVIAQSPALIYGYQQVDSSNPPSLPPHIPPLVNTRPTRGVVTTP